MRRVAALLVTGAVVGLFGVVLADEGGSECKRVPESKAPGPSARAT
jgi:hypothetical protein